MINKFQRASLVAAGVFVGTVSVVVGSGAQYAGQHVRHIKSLSDADIKALRQGRGWGLAKPAELNGYPGPLHVLEFAEELRLSASQRTQIKVVFDEMKAAARRIGRNYLAAEQALGAAFAGHTATPQTVKELTVTAAMLRARLQNVHLGAHLRTTPLLNKAQRHHYAALRGYTEGRRTGQRGMTKGAHGRH